MKVEVAVPNSPYGLCGRKATVNSPPLFMPTGLARLDRYHHTAADLLIWPTREFGLASTLRASWACSLSEVMTLFLQPFLFKSCGLWTVPHN